MGRKAHPKIEGEDVERILFLRRQFISSYRIDKTAYFVPASGLPPEVKTKLSIVCVTETG